MKFLYKLNFRDSMNFLKYYPIHRAKLLLYRLRTGKPWPLYDCYHEKMKEDLDNVPELDSFFVYPIHKAHYKVPVDLAIRDSWMPYLYTNAPFLLFFKNDYSEPGYYADFLPLSIERHPKILVSDYKLRISQEDFDWIVRFVRDNRRDLWIFGHFNDDKACDRILDYIEKHPAQEENMFFRHFEAFRNSREYFTRKVNEAMKDYNLFNALYYCYLYVISVYANDEQYPYPQCKADFDNAVKAYEDREKSIETLKALREIVVKFTESNTGQSELISIPYGWTIVEITGDYYRVAEETEKFFCGISTLNYPPTDNGLSSLISAKLREKDYAGFVYLWAVLVLSTNITEFLYNQYELFWERYEKTPKDTLASKLRNFLDLFGTRLKDGGYIYHKLSCPDFHSEYPLPDHTSSIDWKTGYSLLKNALKYIGPFSCHRIHYTSTDEKTVSPNTELLSGDIICNSYSDGKGLLTYTSDKAEIWNNAFTDCMNLKTIDIPATVSNINDIAFLRCRNLECIYIPESVTRIGHLAFSGCGKLKYFDLPETTTEIDKDMSGNLSLSPDMVRKKFVHRFKPDIIIALDIAAAQWWDNFACQTPEQAYEFAKAIRKSLGDKKVATTEILTETYQEYGKTEAHIFGEYMPGSEDCQETKNSIKVFTVTFRVDGQDDIVLKFDRSGKEWWDENVQRYGNQSPEFDAYILNIKEFVIAKSLSKRISSVKPLDDDILYDLDDRLKLTSRWV